MSRVFVWVLRCWSLALGLALLTSSAQAQFERPLADRPTRLPALGRSVASSDDLTALVLNPANVAMMPGWELRYDAILLDEDQARVPPVDKQVPWQGHAIALGFPLFGGVATGFRLDALDPPSEALFQNYKWFTWGLAYAPSEAASVGFSLQRSFSGDPLADDLLGYSFGLTARPFNWAGLALVAHDINGPTNRGVDPSDPTNTLRGKLHASYDLALAIRPTGTRIFEIGLEGKYLTGPDIWVPRATIGLDIPPIGRLRGEFAITDPAEAGRTWIASAALSFYFSGVTGGTEIYGGMVTGDGLREEESYNATFGGSVRGWREPSGSQGRRYAVKIRLESTPSTRGHVALLRQLWSLADEDKVDAVVFELRTSPGRMARVQELQDAIRLLRSHGKRVLCHIEAGSGASIYMCSAANKIYINPAGGLRFAGLRSQHFYYAGLLEKLGIRADFVRIGSHKSAPEQFTRKGATDVAKKDKTDLLQQHEKHFVQEVARGRQLTVAQVRERIAKGPFVAKEARDAKLVDGFAFDDQIEKRLIELVGRPTLMIEDKRNRVAKKQFGPSKRIAIVHVEGDMIDGRSKTIPFLGNKILGSYTITDTLKQVREDPRVAAVVLRVDTPGGSAMAADLIGREVELIAKKKPIVVSMGGTAASAGYYISAPAKRIFANPLTITGSIGIFYGKADVAQLLQKIGVNVEVYKTAPRADAESIFRPFTPDEKKELNRKVHQFYDLFLTRVAAGRKMTKKQVDAVGQGRVWTGEQALARGLVDELGGLRQALEFVRKEAGLPKDAPIIELPVPDQTLLGRILGVEGLHADAAEAIIPPGLVDMVRALAPFAVHPADQPLARMELEWVDL